MNQQKRRPLFLVVLAIPLRLQYPALNLPFRTIEVEFFSCVKVFTLQLLLGEPRELVHPEGPGVEALGIVIPGVV